MPSSPLPKFTSAALTKELRKLACEIVDVADDGTPITREQKLARIIWQQALGWTETTTDDHGNRVETVHKPVLWAQAFVFERVEGKAQPAKEAEGEKLTAADKVREVARDRANKLAEA